LQPQLSMKPRGLLTEQEVEKMLQLKRSDPAFATMRQLAMRFRGILQGRDPAKLDSWLDNTHRSGRVRLTPIRLYGSE
ncbi:MAG: transposase, partial [Bryobacterales bacterium]|nr:transposase [Bryobacterales bacterium]